MAKPKRDPKTGKFKKSTTTKRRRNPSSSSSSRRSSSTTSRRRRRRRNPSSGGGGGTAVTLSSGTKDLMPVLLSKALLAWGIRTFGKNWGMSAVTGSPISASPYAGQAWPINNYFYALGIGFMLAKALQKIGRGSFARIFWQTTVHDVVTRFIWTEGIARVPGMPAYLGADTPGMIWRDGGGNTMQLDQWGRWQAMQDTLEAARPLDGTLEMQRPLDGLTGARSIDRAAGGYGPRVRWRKGRGRGRGSRYGIRASFGHLLPPDVAQRLATRGSYQGSGYTDPYNAVYGAQ